MLGFVDDLLAQGRALKLDLAGTVEPIRVISDEDQSLYDRAFGPSRSEEEICSIVRRYSEVMRWMVSTN